MEKKQKDDENQTKTITKYQHTCETNQKPSENHDNHETMETNRKNKKNKTHENPTRDHKSSWKVNQNPYRPNAINEKTRKINQNQ